jgi:hypothetical protein
MTIHDEDRDEAERLKLLPLAERKQIIEIIGSVADNPKVLDEDRREARRRADALCELLRLKPREKDS